jgi:hypothetical protein
VSQQPPKKPASRDINDLKARLGIKKGTSPQTPVGSKTAGMPAVVPPPGLAVPPPPGAVPPQPPQPVVPNAAEDPFGAMNAMAQMGAAQRAPEIVIVNDGKPVESVGREKKGVKYAILGGAGLVLLLLGMMLGGAGKNAAFYNAGIRDSRAILKDVKSVKKALVSLNEAVAKAKDSAGKDVTTAMNAVDKVGLDQALIFRAKQNNLNPELSVKILQFYAQVAQLKAMIADHQRTARADAQALGAAREATEKMMLPPNSAFEKAVRVRYGVLVWNPSAEESRTDQDFGARLVELGPPFCTGETKPAASGTCPEGAVETLSYRVNPSGTWQRGDFAIPGQNIEPGASIPPKKLLIMSPTGVFDGLIQGAAGMASTSLYVKRVEAIREKVAELIEAGNELEARLGPKANESERFSFFM